MQMAIRALDAKSDRTDPTDYHRDPQEVRRRLEDRMVREAREAGMTLREQTEPVTPDAN